MHIQGRGDRWTGGSPLPLKKLGGGDGRCFYPPIFRKCLANLQRKPIIKREK